MLKAYVLEGARGVGKSETTQLLRSSIWGSTLINLTGFEQDGDEGLSKTQHYYEAVMVFLKTLAQADHPYTVIFDRLFFSEMVYAPLYKSYDFTSTYEVLCEELVDICDELNLYFLTVDDEDVLTSRLCRDKALLFDAVKESAENSLSQQTAYRHLFMQLRDKYRESDKLHFTEINTSSLTPQAIKNMILKE